MNQLKLAQTIAYMAHRGQVDKGGERYIEHPAGVAYLVKRAGYDEDVQAVAWLHDVLEDTDVEPDDLGAMGVNMSIIHAVAAMSRRPDETPEVYYERVKANDWAYIVKRFDIEHNTDPNRLALLNNETIVRLIRKYAKARLLLGYYHT